MKMDIRVLLFCSLIIMTLAIIISNGIVQSDVFSPIPYQRNPLQVPAWSETATGRKDLIIDKFEYWDSPFNHGWMQLEPRYPVYGFGIGYATIFKTVLDLNKGSRVLDVYRPPAVFLLNTPYEKHRIFYNLYTPPLPGSTSIINYIDLAKTPILSFQFRAPIGIESFDIFEFEVLCITKAGYNVLLRISPIQPSCAVGTVIGSSTFNIGRYQTTIADVDLAGNLMVIQVNLGCNLLDGTWHVLWMDIIEAVQQALDNYDGGFGSIAKSDWEIIQAERIQVSGQMFRLDDIIFRAEDFTRLNQPDIFEPGPLYAQIFEPYRYLFFADYEVHGKIEMITNLLLDMNNFITDPNRISDQWVADLLRLDPNYHIIDPNHSEYNPEYTDRWIPGDPNFGRPDHVAEIHIREGFFIDSTLPIFADQDLRITGEEAAELENHGNLSWNMTVGGYGGWNQIQAFLLQPLPINPYDGMPTYIPAYYNATDAVKAHGKAHFRPLHSLALESAMWNSGIKTWSNIVYVDYTPQYFEDLVITLELTNGIQSDVRTFPISVVNYPVENYAPVIQLQLPTRSAYVGELAECIATFIDTDCYIFSLTQFEGRMPSTTHLPMLPGNKIRNDQEKLTYRAILNGLPSYQFGPWRGPLVDTESGLTSFIPKFEGIYELVVTCTDDRGATAWGRRRLFITNPHSWFNHPPIPRGSPTRPIVVKAGEEVILTAPDFNVIDPDGDELFVSCNIGSCGRLSDGAFLWCFQTNFPGIYNVEIIFYDIRGGYMIRSIPIIVKPWWSY